MALRNAPALSKGHRPKVQNLICGSPIATLHLCALYEELREFAEPGLGLSN